jgi:cyclic pyranopterin phosphate synthase
MTAKGKSQLSHTDDEGNARMVDVGDKAVTDRRAVAEGMIRMQVSTLRLIIDGEVQKGDVLAVARLAAIQGAKQTSNLIPLCHPLPLDNVAVELEEGEDDEGGWIRMSVTTRVTARTGVEMEALSAVSVGLLTIYDMCKAVDRFMRIDNVQLIEKKGGKSGHWVLP